MKVKYILWDADKSYHLQEKIDRSKYPSFSPTKIFFVDEMKIKGKFFAAHAQTDGSLLVEYKVEKVYES